MGLVDTDGGYCVIEISMISFHNIIGLPPTRLACCATTKGERATGMWHTLPSTKPIK